MAPSTSNANVDDLKSDPYKTVEPPVSTHPENATWNNSHGALSNLDADALERFKIREICEGWPTHRDAAEWEKYRSMFHDDAFIATSWSQGRVDEFIESSKKA